MGHPEAVLRVALPCLGFFLLHSILVTEWFKSLALRALGPRLMSGWYRLAYTCLSVLTLLAALWLITRVPDMHIYSFPALIAWPMHGVQLMGLAFGYLSYRQLRTGEFTGIDQARGFLRGQEPVGDMEGITDGSLMRTGGYAVVRNPLYLAGIVIFAFEPNLTRSWLTVSALSIGYFVWGAWIEQRRMLGRLGGEYAEYMKEVPLLLPGPRALVGWLRQGSRYKSPDTP